MPNKKNSKASPAGNNEERSSAPLVPKQPRVRKNRANVVDQSTQMPELPSDLPSDSPSDLVEQSAETEVSPSPSRSCGSFFQVSATRLLGVVNSVLEKVHVVGDGNPEKQKDSALDDLNRNPTAVAELQPEPNPDGAPLAKRQKQERTQDSDGPSSEPPNRTNDKESNSAQGENQEMAETEPMSSSTSVGGEDGPRHVSKPEDI